MNPLARVSALALLALIWTLIASANGQDIQNLHQEALHIGPSRPITWRIQAAEPGGHSLEGLPVLIRPLPVDRDALWADLESLRWFNDLAAGFLDTKGEVVFRNLSGRGRNDRLASVAEGPNGSGRPAETEPDPGCLAQLTAKIE